MTGDNGITFRALRADEIEIRQGGPIGRRHGVDGLVCPLLLYKDARVDQNILDETLGVLGWKREHSIEEGRCFCTVSVWDERKTQWISKKDVGCPPSIEEVKGECSDAFKRACTNLGIGRELYSLKGICVIVSPSEIDGDHLAARFRVSSIEVDTESRRITSLEIRDREGNVRYEYGKAAHEDTRPCKDPFADAIQSTGGVVLTAAHPDFPALVERLSDPMTDARKTLSGYAMTENVRKELGSLSGRTDI